MAKFITLSPVSSPSLKIAVNVEAITAIDHIRWTHSTDDGSFIYLRGWKDSGIEAVESVEEVVAMITGDPPEAESSSA